MILVDSTIYIDWLRGRVEPLGVLEPWVQTHSAFTCGVIRAEVVRGVLDAHQKIRTHELFDLLQDIPTDARLWVEASELAWTLDRQGVVIPLTDVVIAACARRAAATVITTDKHFSRIPGLSVRATVT
ncbi:MAG: hypothetical protein DMG07_04435 [Acidobacteria bacterium]|nr:MAG: hypothetical protein DMG07_04435 [Acidobacteriota bacterium]